MSAPTHRVAVIGGGLLGLTAAYRLARAGVAVTVYERDAGVGGLARSSDLGGIAVDRYYHVVLPTDDRVRGLAGELGIGDRMRFARTRVGHYHGGGLTSISSPKELLAFKALRPADRLRLAAFAVRCQLKRGHDDLDDVPLLDWLERVCGSRLTDELWRPLLDSKFDGVYEDLPATYLWARSRRMSATRDKTAQEVMGTIDGGYQLLADRLDAAIRRAGGEVLTRRAVRKIASSGGRAIGVVDQDGFRPFDHVISTLLPVHAAPLLPSDLAAIAGPDPVRYIGVVCLVARLRRSLSPYYSINIADRTIPLTTVVETTHVVDPDAVGGTLVYVPKYVNPDSPELERSNREIRDAYLGHVRTIFPAFDDRDVLSWQVARAPQVEPVHTIGGAARIPPLTPAKGLTLASTAHIYPELVNGQAVLGVAERVVADVLPRLHRLVVAEAA
jgi:protoporphyrinogen oxidase